jgi:hypothetical protein
MTRSLEDLVAAGARDRSRVAASWDALERTTRHLSSEAVAGVETAGATLKWGSLFLLAAAILARGGKFRSGWKIGKLIWAVAPALTKLAMPGGIPRLSHLFGRGNPKKG